MNYFLSIDSSNTHRKKKEKDVAQQFLHRENARFYGRL